VLPCRQQEAEMTIFKGEPKLDDLLSDPIILAMMESDGVDRDRLGLLLKSARQGLHKDAARHNVARVSRAS
jgi:hypothetical protein